MLLEKQDYKIQYLMYVQLFNVMCTERLIMQNIDIKAVNNELSPSKRRSSLILVRSSRLLFALGCKLLITTVGQGKGAGALVRIEKY
uniref:Uncharacterized protein n=1 Tax=Glossina palpalis gambiensis TaxID=67801 RepID=A0A1B0AXD7_9MUSC